MNRVNITTLFVFLIWLWFVRLYLGWIEPLYAMDHLTEQLLQVNENVPFFDKKI